MVVSECGGAAANFYSERHVRFRHHVRLVRQISTRTSAHENFEHCTTSRVRYHMMGALHFLHAVWSRNCLEPRLPPVLLCRYSGQRRQVRRGDSIWRQLLNVSATRRLAADVMSCSRTAIPLMCKSTC